MKLTVVGLGGKHELEVKAADTLAAVKAQLAPLVSLSPEELKLVAKGKAPPDATPLSALGLADGGKLMLMRSQAGAKSLQQRGKAAAPASATSANSRPLGAPPWLSIGCEVDYLDSGGERHSAVVQAIHTDDAPQLYCTVALAGGGERQTPLDRVQPRGGGGGAGGGGVGGRGAVTAAGEGPVLLSVSQGASKFELRCEPHSTVLSLKALLAPLPISPHISHISPYLPISPSRRCSPRSSAAVRSRRRCGCWPGGRRRQTTPRWLLSAWRPQGGG